MQRLLWLLVVLGGLAACSSDRRGADPSPPRQSVATKPAPLDEGTPARKGRRRIAILGDSLTAGLGLEPSQAYPSLLQQRLDAEGYAYDVVNAGVSGDTSAGGLRRLDWALEGDVAIVVVALGGNDGLRGLPVEQLRANLDEIMTRARKRNVAVVLAGMEAPPNYGPEYTAGFRNTYRELARKHGVPLLPFLLEGVAGVTGLNGPDGIHPNAEGARMVAANVWKDLAPLLERTRP